MKKRKPIHTTKAGTVTEILKALKISKKDYRKVVKEIQQLENNHLEGYDPFPIR